MAQLYGMPKGLYGKEKRVIISGKEDEEYIVDTIVFFVFIVSFVSNDTIQNSKSKILKSIIQLINPITNIPYFYAAHSS